MPPPSSPSSSTSASLTPDESSSSTSTSALSITIRIQGQEEFLIGTDTGYRLYIDVTAAEGISDKIFRYYQEPLNAITEDADSVYSGVCTWPDLSNLPETEPTATTDPQAFRLDYVDVVVQGTTQAEALTTEILANVQVLLNSITRGLTLQTINTVTITPS